MKRWRLAMVAAMIACAWPVSAATPEASARFSKSEAAVSKHVASRYWRSLKEGIFKRSSYHCGPTEVSLVWLANLGDAMASADIWGCRDDPPEIRLEEPTVKGLGDIHACGVITHEYGHLLGYRHVRNRNKVMSGEPSIGERPPAEATWERAWRRCDRHL
jgi:hypothetical protein